MAYNRGVCRIRRIVSHHKREKTSVISDKSLHQIKLSQLRILIAVATYGNFSEAALHLELSQSAVSHAIATLEDLIGVVLFNRGRHGASLTAVGEKILRHAQQIEHLLEAISHEAMVVRGLSGGEVRLASFRSIATRILPAIVGEFYQKHPQIKVSFTEYDDFRKVEQSLRAGQTDVGFTMLPSRDDMITRELLQDEFVVILPASFVPKSPQLSWEEVTQQPMIIPPHSSTMMQPLYAHLQHHGHCLNVASEVETDAMIINLVSQNLGGTILPRLAAEPIPASLQVFSLPVPLYRKMGIATFAEAMHPPAVYAFLEVLKK